MNIEKHSFKKICLMHLQALTNFPYIEKDFDALTDYELLSKVVDYLNQVITNTNEQNTVVENLYNAFIELKDYVDNYFDTLDVQDEVNNKLDEMAESGQLEEIISQYLNSRAIFGFNTVNDMKQATNLINGSYAKTLGNYSINDGESILYKITDEPIENLNYIQLNNGLYANEINNFNENYYDEINYTQGRIYDTDYYIVEIPLKDKNNNLIPISVNKSTTDSPLQFAQNNKTNLTINAGLTHQNAQEEWKQSIVIGNGEVLHGISPDITLESYYTYIGFNENREILEFQANETSVEDMLSAGVKNAYLVFYRYMNNGQLEEHTDAGNWTVKSPRMDIGVKENGDLVILVCDGRTNNNEGLDNEQALAIMQTKNCVKAWRCDGGGSTSLSIRGEKINRNIDEKGTLDRKIEYTLNVFKNIKNNKLAEKYTFDSRLRQLLNKQIRDDFEQKRINDKNTFEYERSSIFLTINNNALNNITTADTWQTAKFTVKYRHNEKITAIKDDDNNTIGVHLNGNGMYRVVFFANFESNAAGQKSLKINKNNEIEWPTVINISETSQAYKQLTCETVVNNNTDDVMDLSFHIKSNHVGDRFIRMNVFVESLGDAI